MGLMRALREIKISDFFFFFEVLLEMRRSAHARQGLRGQCAGGLSKFGWQNAGMARHLWSLITPD